MTTAPKPGQILLCPNCTFRISLINTFSSTSAPSSQLSINSTCNNPEHKCISESSLQNLQNSIKHCKLCNSKANVIGKYFCSNCNMFFCDQCSKVHEKKDPSHFISLYVVKSNKVCHKHKDRLACYSCKKCDILICEDCIKKHKSHDIKKDLLRNKKHNNDKQHILQIKKQQLKQIDNLISQLMNAFEAVQCEIQQIEKEINNK